MAKFFYKLQNVLDLKLKMEDQAKTAFSAAMARVTAEEEKLNGLYERRRVYEEEFRSCAVGAIKPLDLKHAKESLNLMEELIKEQMNAVKNARKNLEVARYRLNEAIKERKIQEKLKENAFEQFKAELNEEEKKEIDQLVSYRFNKNGKAGVK